MSTRILFLGSKINQILCAVTICLPVFSYGNSLGWMSPMALLLQSEDSPRGEPLPDIEISWMASVPYLASVPLYYLLAFTSDRYGRKSTLLVSAIVGSGIWILKLCSTSFWAFIIARCLIGVVMAVSFVTCPVYIKEISENNIRGVLGCFPAVFYTGGSLFNYIIGDMLSYRTILLVCVSISLVGFLLCLSLPESPSYLVKTGKIEEAQKVLLWLRRQSTVDDGIQQEIEVIKAEQKNDEMSNNESLIKTILTDRILFKAFQIAMMAALAREVCGAVPVNNFAGNIFQEAASGTKLVLNPNQQAMMLGSVQCLGSILASSLVEKCGRRPLLFITCIISGLSMCLLASWFVLKDFDIHAPSWIPVTTLCVCIFCDSAGLLPLGTVITGEIFSFKYRGTVLATSMAFASLIDFFQVLFFKLLAGAIGVKFPFYIFGAMCLLTALYVILSVPETKTRPLDEIYNDLRSKKEKREPELQNEYISRF
ncbi:facilitated trehalose transporter Tret1-like [Zerene cesonia]|uniref:facilitated trehalose transporter Tret1-like n=1 Tax=Zerene cesonia TaxID=33412 RepID=UPI0018E5A2EA|nr:facilitated trehalose transporter Tret1-like [Zerene cesonia]